MNYYAAFFGRFRLLLAAGVLLTTALAIAGIWRLRFDSDPRTLINTSGEARRQLQRLEEEFGRGNADCIMLVTADDVTTLAGVQTVLKIAQGAQQIDGVEHVVSMISARGDRRLGDYFLPLFPLDPRASEQEMARARSQARRSPLLMGRLLSEDLTTALINVRLAEHIRDEGDVQRVVRQLRQLGEQSVQDRDMEVHMTGLPVLRLEMLQSLLYDQVKFNVIGITAACLVSLLVFRSATSTLIVVVGSATGVLWTLGLMGLAGVRINFINSVIPPLVLVIGVSDAMHLLLDIRRWNAGGQGAMQAARTGIVRVGPACALTSLTTMVGFGSLALGSVDSIQWFGIWAATGCALNFVAVIIVVPLLASTSLGDRLGAEMNHMQRFASGLAATLWPVIRRSRLVSAVGVLVTAALFFSSLTLQAENRLTETISSTRPAYQSLQLCDRKFGGALPLAVVLQQPAAPEPDWPHTLQVLEQVHEAVEAQGDLSLPTSLLTLVQSLPGDDLSARLEGLGYLSASQIRQFINADATRMVVRARIPDVGSKTLSPQFDALEGDLKRIQSQHPGYQLQLTGGTVMALRNLQSVIKDLWRSLSAAGVVILVVLTVSLRSLRLGLASVVPNAFPLVCAAGLLVAWGRPLEICSVVVFSVCLGIATDDTIHFLVRYQHQRRNGASPAQAVRQSIEIVGEALIMTTVVLTIGMGSVMFSEIPALRTFGQLATVALATALLGDLLILPALLLLSKVRPTPTPSQE